MNKFVLTALVAATFQFSFATSPVEVSKHRFMFSSMEPTQTSWEYIHLKYAVSDATTGDNVEVPSALINYDVKDHSGKLISSGSGGYVKVNDAKLGSEEEYCVNIYTLINGEVVSQTINKKASPKRVTMKLNTAFPTTNTKFIETSKLDYTVTRPKYDNQAESEPVAIAASDMYIDVVLEKCDGCASTAMEGVTAHLKMSEIPDYTTFESNLNKMVKELKKVKVGFKPSLVIKDKVYTEAPIFYTVTENGVTAMVSDNNK